MAVCRSWEVPISAKVMGAAIQLGRYAVAHALAAFGTCATDADTALAKKVLEVIREKGWVDFSKRELMRAARGPDSKAFDQALMLLDDYGYIRKDILEREADLSAGRPAGVRWVVNPAVMEGRC
jgi:hypothetical protein